MTLKTIFPRWKTPSKTIQKNIGSETMRMVKTALLVSSIAIGARILVALHYAYFYHDAMIMNLLYTLIFLAVLGLTSFMVRNIGHIMGIALAIMALYGSGFSSDITVYVPLFLVLVYSICVYWWKLPIATDIKKV